MASELIAEANPAVETTEGGKAPERASGMGALLGGVLASSCCILPLPPLRASADRADADGCLSVFL